MMMRTSVPKVSMGLLICVALTAMTACAGSSDSGTPAAQAADVPVSIEEAAAATDEPVVVMEVESEAVLKEDYATLKELSTSPNVKLVISGTVTAAEPVYQEHVAYTKLTVKVAKSSDASIAVGTSVVVWRDGGRVPLSEVLPDLKPEQTAGLPTTAPANAVVDFKFLGAEQSAVGDQIMAFLRPDTNVGREGAYRPVSSVHGLLKLDSKAGKYNRLGHAEKPGFEAAVSVSAAEGLTRRR